MDQPLNNNNNNENLLNQVLETLKDLNTRLINIENLKTNKPEELFDLNDLDEQSEEDYASIKADPRLKRRSTMDAASVDRRDLPVPMQTIYTIKPLEIKLQNLKPKNLIRFISTVTAYQENNNIRANLADCLEIRASSALVAASEGKYTSSDIGTITLKDLVKISRRHLQVYTTKGFLTELSAHATFPNSNMTLPDHRTFRMFRSLLKQYEEDFTMVVDLLSYNAESIPPITNKKDLGLIDAFNRQVPFGFAEGVYDQINSKETKKKWPTIQVYLADFDAKVEEYYDNLNNTSSFYDAFKKPAYLPKPYEPRFNADKQKTSNYKKSNKNINILEPPTTDSDLSSVLSFDSHTTGSYVSVNKIEGEIRPCYAKALKGTCDRPNCRHSHDDTLIEKQRLEFIQNLQKLQKKA